MGSGADSDADITGVEAGRLLPLVPLAPENSGIDPAAPLEGGANKSSDTVLGVGSGPEVEEGVEPVPPSPAAGRG